MPAYDIGPRIGIEGEKEFKNSIKAIDSEIRALQNQLRTLSKEYDENDRSVEGVTKKQQALTKAIGATQDKIKLLTSQYDKQYQELKRLETALDSARQLHGENSEEALKAESALAKQATEVNNLESRLQTAKGQLATFSQELENTGNRATLAGDKIQSAGDKLEAVGGKLSSAGNTLTAAVTAPLLAAGGAAIVMASDYEESLNKVDVAFGDSAERVKEFAQTTVDSYGIAEGTALDMAALFGDMATSMKIPREEAAEMSERLVGLAGDLASFKNISLDQVGTALKSIFTGETESLKELGVVMTEANLDAFALAEGFGKTTDEMTEAEKVQLRYQYVLSATQNAQGDYARTADGTANSLRTLQESAKELGVAFGQELLPQITPLIQKGTKLVKSFGEMGDEEKKLMVSTAAVAAAAGPAVKVLGTATTGLGKLAKGAGTVVGDLGKLVQSGGKATEGMSLFGKVLGTLGPKGLIIGGVVAGAAAIGTAIVKAREDVINAEIDEAFGDIKLSAEEVEDVAQRLTTTDWKMKITAAVDAQAQVETLKTDVEAALGEINKLNWKVQIGLDLSEEEQSTYISQFEQYVQGIQDTIAQQGYSSSLAIDVVFGDGDSFGKSLQAFYSDYITEASSSVDQWGQTLAQRLNDSFANNTFSQDLTDIQQMIENLNSTMQEVLGYGYDAKLAQFELEYDKLLISESSYDALVEELGKNQQEMAQYIEEITEPILVPIRARYNRMLEQGVPEEFAKAVYDDSLSYVQDYVNQMDVENITLSFGAAFDQLNETEFGESIRKATEDVQKEAQGFSQAFVDAFEQGGIDLQNAFLQFQEGFPQLAGGAQKKVQELVKAFQPQKEHLEALRDSYIEIGQQVPGYISDGLSDIEALEAMAGSADGMYSMLGKALSDSPQLLETLTQSQLSGRAIPQELANAIAMYSGYVYNSATGMWTQLSDDTAQAAQEMADLMNQYGISYSSEYAEGIASQYGLVYENGRWLVQKTADGVRDNTPTLLMEAEKSASDTVNQFDTTISGATVGPVKVATPDIASSVGVALDIAQSVANSRTIYYTVAARGAVGLTANSVSAYADGGLVDEPQLALIGEAGDEMVIPLERNRSRALDLWYQAGQELNAFAADSARAVGAIRREQIINNTTNRNMAINNAEGAIVIHTQATDGKQLYKELVREMQKDVKRKEAAYGKN